MASFHDRQPRNAPGKLYVDDQCLDSTLCHKIAPNNFARDDANGRYYILKQPETPEELAQCLEAADSCPVCAIGTDGDQSHCRRSWWRRLLRPLANDDLDNNVA